MGRKLSDKEKEFISLSKREEFEKILESLVITDRQKEIAMLYYFHGNSYSEIGDIVGASERTISREIRAFSKKLNSFIEL